MVPTRCVSSGRVSLPPPKQVSVIGTEILARAYQATAVSPVAVPAWGIPPAADSTPSSCQRDVAGTASSASLALYDYRREAAEVRTPHSAERRRLSLVL